MLWWCILFTHVWHFHKTYWFVIYSRQILQYVMCKIHVCLIFLSNQVSQNLRNYHEVQKTCVYFFPDGANITYYDDCRCGNFLTGMLDLNNKQKAQNMTLGRKHCSSDCVIDGRIIQSPLKVKEFGCDQTMSLSHPGFSSYWCSSEWCFIIVRTISTVCCSSSFKFMPLSMIIRSTHSEWWTSPF